MDCILASSRSSLLFFYPISHPSLSPFSRTRRVKLRRLKHSELLKSRSKFQLVRCKFSSYSSPQAQASSSERAEAEASLLKCVARQIALALVCVAVGFAPIRTGVRGGAIAAPATAEVAQRKEKASVKGDEYREFTRKFLKTVSLVLEAVEEAREGDDGGVKKVEAAMAAVRARKEKLGKEIGDVHYEELKKLRDEKEPLEKRSEEIVAVAMTKDDATEEMSQLEKEYDSVSARLGELEDQIMRREISVVNVLEELSFIQSECEQFVSSFKKELRLKSMQSEPKAPITKLSKSDIQKELETVRRKSLEQAILPKVLEEEDIESFVGKDSVSFGQRIKQCVEDSRSMQIKAEAQIRRSMKKFGDEKRFVVNTPEKEVVRGYPEVELKWMFGDKEVVPPKAAKLNLYNGWKKWREEAKEETKKKMLEDVEFGRSYVAQRQERILVDRDRVLAKTWYNEEKDRWEMDPSVVPFAVSNKLVEYARIRHDWGIMYLAIKGDVKEYFVDLMEFDLLYEDFGGFDGIYMKMIAAGVPMVVQPMWIPFSELDIHQQFRLSLRLFRSAFDMFLNEEKILVARNLIQDTVVYISDGILMIVVFPLLDSVIPSQLRVRLGMAWPDEVGESLEASRYLTWQTEVEQRYLSRIKGQGGIQFFCSFIAISAITGYVLVHVLRFVKERVLPFVGLGPYRRDPTKKKIQTLIKFGELRKKKIEQIKKEGTDPISRAFERMKRVKDPPITLNEFAGIESMREELNEVVAFLQNPRAFQEMGARAPRGVLIVGERGTGKTSLALAIAAEARVPLVEVKSKELEAGLWVGQSASNVRELFQTARDLAPVIIFVEDFDLFAGVRGTFINTQNQDHEAFINQLLVELDGFEKQDGVVLMSTTRHLQKIDEALRRPGRMDRIFHLQRPTQNEREKILKTAAKETMESELIDFVDWKKVAEKTALMLPAELKFVPLSLEYNAFRNSYLDVDELLGYSSFFATFSGFVPKWVWKTGIAKRLSKMLVNHLGLTLTKEDLQSVVDLMEPYGQISNGIELLSPPIDWTRETKFPHAVWAAGRGLIALLLPNFDVVDNLWLEPTSWQGIGCTKITKAKNESSLNGNPESRSYLEKKLVFCFGSHIASQMLLPFGEENLLSSSELQQAQEIATRMVIQYGWGPDDSPAIYYHNNASTAMSMGDKYQYEMAEKVEKIFDLAYLKAKEMMQTNRKVLEKIVEELMEFEILSGKDLENLLESNGGIKMKEPFFLSKAYDREPSSRSFIDIESTSTTNLLTGATQG